MGHLIPAFVRAGPIVSPSTGGIMRLDGADMQPFFPASVTWWSSFTGTAPTIAAGITGAHDRVWQENNSGRPNHNLQTATNTPSGGVRFRIDEDTAATMFRFFTGSDNHIGLAYVVGGNFRVLRDTAQLAITTSAPIALNTWYNIELTAVIGNAGSFTANLYDDSGTLLDTLTGSGVDTQDGATTTVNVMAVGLLGHYEDFWVDSSGELYGPWRIETLAPNGAGDLTELTRGGTDSGANYSQVNEVPVQIGGAGDDYNDSTGDDQHDCYTFTNRNIAGTPRAIGVHAVCQRITGTPQFQLFCRIGGVTYLGALTFTATSANVFYSEYWQNNPATGLAWTDSEIDAAQFGVKALDTQLRVRGFLAQVLVEL